MRIKEGKLRKLKKKLKTVNGDGLESGESMRFEMKENP